MNWLFVILVIAVLALIFVVVLGPLGELPPAEPDLRPDELDGQPQFDVVIRGYRMDEVDAQIAALQSEVRALRGGGEPATSDAEAGDDVSI